MFRKRHFAAIAEAIQEATLCCDTNEQRRGVELLREELATLFKRSNGQFDRQRFERACIPNTNVRART